jgi:putative methionine-R-sulfoxide reductase with GAF domain
VIREMVVPVWRDKQIVAIMGVGNKPADYTPEDLKAL